MALKVVRVPAYGVKITSALKGKVVGRAYLYVMTNDLHERPFGLMEDVFVDATKLSGHLLVGLLDHVVTGPGFLGLGFEIIENGVILVDMSFNDSTAAASYFSDRVLDLGTFPAESDLDLTFDFTLK